MEQQMTILHKVGIYAIIGVAVSTAVFLGYNHYVGLLDTITRLEKDVTTLTVSFDLEKETNNQLTELVTEWQIAAEAAELRAQLAAENEADARTETRRLNDIFARHNLTLLARAKPGLIERRINDGTDRVFSVLTCETTTPGRCDSSGRPEADPTETPEP